MPEPFVIVSVSPERTAVEQAIAQSGIDEPEPYDPWKIDPRVLRGARFLDVKIPGWAQRIDLDDFDIGDGGRCVLGQTMTGGYVHGVKAFWGDQAESYPSSRAEGEAAKHGFTSHADEDSDWDVLEKSWRAVIGERQRAAAAV